MDDLLEDCGIEELYPEYKQEGIVPQIAEEAELEAKYPGVMVQFFGEEGYRITGEAIHKNTGKYVARVKATTMDEAKKLLDEKLATTKYYKHAQ